LYKLRYITTTTAAPAPAAAAAAATTTTTTITAIIYQIYKVWLWNYAFPQTLLPYYAA